MREIYARYLELENADNKQSEFVNELKNKVQDLLKRSFLNNIGSFFTVIEKVLNDFKSRAFPIINENKTLTREPTTETAPEPLPETTHKLAPNLKAFDTPKTNRKISPLKLRGKK